MAIRRDFPYFWATWLPRLLVGDRSCEWAVWFKAHYQDFERHPSDFDQAEWQRRHTSLLARTAEWWEEHGAEVRLEQQNAFRLRGETAVLAGRPDLVAVRDQRIDVIDVKTGEPRPWHTEPPTKRNRPLRTRGAPSGGGTAHQSPTRDPIPQNGECHEGGGHARQIHRYYHIGRGPDHGSKRRHAGAGAVRHATQAQQRRTRQNALDRRKSAGVEPFHQHRAKGADMAEPLHITPEERARIAAGLAAHEQISRRLSAETDGLEQNHPHQWAGMNSDMQLILADTLPELLEKLRPDSDPERNVVYTYLDPDPPELIL